MRAVKAREKNTRDIAATRAAPSGTAMAWQRACKYLESGLIGTKKAQRRKADSTSRHAISKKRRLLRNRKGSTIRLNIRNGNQIDHRTTIAIHVEAATIWFGHLSLIREILRRSELLRMMKARDIKTREWYLCHPHYFILLLVVKGDSSGQLHAATKSCRWHIYKDSKATTYLERIYHY